MSLAVALLFSVTLSQISQANLEINRRMVYEADAPGQDTWGSRDGVHGDCEDYALEKRRLLLQMGASESDLRVVTGRDWRGDPHAVLFARDNEGRWWVLDSQSNRVANPDRHSMTYSNSPIWGRPR